jgi:hypothetical protein
LSAAINVRRRRNDRQVAVTPPVAKLNVGLAFLSFFATGSYGNLAVVRGRAMSMFNLSPSG